MGIALAFFVLVFAVWEVVVWTLLDPSIRFVNGILAPAIGVASILLVYLLYRRGSR